MSDSIRVKYRTWYQGNPPKPIKLQIPGWAGQDHSPMEAGKIQPWQCPPFTEGNTYGLELTYPFDTECHIRVVDGQVRFEGDFTEELKKVASFNIPLPPFKSFSPGYFGMTSCLDIDIPEGYILRIEPHPRFYTDDTWTVPAAIPGHIQPQWWTKIFFVAFKYPRPGQTYIFRKNEPYAQLLILPKKVSYDIKEMTPEEIEERQKRDWQITQHAQKISKSVKTSHGHDFDHKYQILRSIYLKKGKEGVNEFLDGFEKKNAPKIQNKFIVRKKKYEN